MCMRKSITAMPRVIFFDNCHFFSKRLLQAYKCFELLQLYYAFHNALLNSFVISKINSTTNNEQVSQYGTKWEEN